MPTGYTSGIYEGKGTSFEEYMLSCAKAFGANISLRELPLGSEIPVYEPDNYHIECFGKTLKKLQKTFKMSDEEIQEEITKRYESTVNQKNEGILKANTLSERYKQMLDKVELWQPPTNEHLKLKEFALEQLKISIENDCRTSYLDNLVSEMETVKEYRDRMFSICKKDLLYHLDSYNREIERVKERNKWNSELRKSLSEEVNKNV